MNLLPKKSEEFAKTDYWNSFFKKRGEKAFEWYGEYIQLCDHIHKYVKLSDKILMLGCGNSKLSMDMYDNGFWDITNIDISPIAIKRMIDINANKRPGMQFLEMDATKMTFEDEKFTVALDKGTLDALFIDNSPETKAVIERYLKEIMRTMRNGGRYLCVSLLQEHILKYLLEFLPTNSFMIRIVYCLDAANSTAEDNNLNLVSMPVFIVVATKFTLLPSPIFEFSLDNVAMKRVKTACDLDDAVSSLQKAAIICNGLVRGNIAGYNEVSMELFKPGDNNPRYTVYILDQPPKSTLKRYAAFLVPQGRENEYLFSTPEGRKHLQESSEFQRLLIITLHRDQVYNSLAEVKEELIDSIKSVAPQGFKEMIPILSLGNEIGKRETLVTGFSQISGEFRIEEVEGENGQVMRRLIFLSNEMLVQSEALVKIIKPKGKKERKKIDIGYLACQHHVYMSTGIQMATNTCNNKNKGNVLVIGLGGGSLCTFLHEALPYVRVTAVEIDPIMLEIAEQFFELKQDDRLHVVIDDGLDFISKCKEEGINFDVVLFDVDSKDSSIGMSCPPKSFVNPAVLKNIKYIIGPKGIFLLNLACRNKTMRDDVIKVLKEIFPYICSYKIEDEINEVVYCTTNEKFQDLTNWKRMLGNAARNFNTAVKDKHLTQQDMLNISKFLNKLSL
ncbi:eEF1A lysine and N-terminal methyltransferase homolog [Teleopsis dalmanni]|uniref:eEF1A lysine and N-terminal methyltransferase homolog n=1 Tax=Teleopsis dalmanni TaxID=139649 RepID=UPI0018CF460B|nr:eEF1A lysine and N-terminal methyltransferase homolog [Teleopsis dalmanni]